MRKCQYFDVGQWVVPFSFERMSLSRVLINSHIVLLVLSLPRPNLNIVHVSKIGSPTLKRQAITSSIPLNVIRIDPPQIKLPVLAASMVQLHDHEIILLSPCAVMAMHKVPPVNVVVVRNPPPVAALLGHCHE